MDNPRALLAARDSTSESKLLTLVGVTVVIAGLYFGRPVLIPLALAGVFAFLLTPMVELLEKLHLGRVLSVLLILFLFMALLAAVGWGATNQLMQIMVRLPDYRTNIHNKIQAIRAPSSGGLSTATEAVNNLSKELSVAAEPAATNRQGRNEGKEPIAVQVATPARNASEYLRDLIGPLTGILETTGIMLIFTLFVLMKREDLRNRLLRLAGSGQLNVMTQAMDDASKRLSRYLWLQFLVNLGYGLLFGLGTYAIGIPHPLLWGVLASLLRFIPYFGTAIAAVFPMVMAIAVFSGWTQVGLTFALFLCLEITIANVIEPWLYGTHTGVSSLAILVAAVFWGMLWGPVGLILSTPLTVCLILLGRYVPQLTFLDILLGDEPVLPPKAHFYQRLLAMDEGETKEIVDKFLKENPLGTLYDSVLIPALSLAEQDRHTDALDEVRLMFIHQRTRELVEELYEASQNATSSVQTGVSEAAVSVPASGPRIVCIPARDEADEIVGTMVTQLLCRAGHDAHSLPIGAVSTMMEQLDPLRPDVVCVSALPPFAASQAKSLCKQLRHKYPKVKIVLGLWEYPGGLVKARERVGTGYADLIGTSAAQIVTLMEASTLLASSTAPEGPEMETSHAVR